VLHVGFRKIEHPIDEDRQVLGQVSAFARVGDGPLQVLRRSARVDVVHRFHAQQLQEEVGCDVEHGDEPAEYREVHLRRARQAERERFGGGDREILRVQLPEDHLHDRRRDEHAHRGDRHGEGERDVEAAQEHAQRLADQRLGDVPDQQAGDGDAELSAGEHERGASGHRERPLRSDVPGVRARGESGAVDRHVGELLRHEVPVHRDDDEDQDDADQQHQHCGAHAGVTPWTDRGRSRPECGLSASLQLSPGSSDDDP
jgi:hypothetical protein